MCHRTRFLSAWGLAALCLIAAPPNPAAASDAKAGTEVALSGSRVSMMEKDRIVASFDATGDIRGMVTVWIDRDAKGALTGEWFLVSRYVQDLNANGEVDDALAIERAALPGAELHRMHHEYIGIHEGGTLRGTITGGALSLDVDGVLRGIDALQLAIDGGNIEFTGAKGTAQLSASNLRDLNGTGTIRFAPDAVTRAAATEEVRR
jgi:hypothetical protein